MTAQISENVLYNGKEHAMCTEPLAMYFALGGNSPGFQFSCTALWRGYIGSWEIIDDRLYIVGLAGRLKTGADANLATIFPDFPERAFAHWYSGMVRLPMGKLLQYVHGGYCSTYERDLFLTFEKGVISKTELVSNGESLDPTAQEGYGVAALTTFPFRKNDAGGEES